MRPFALEAIEVPPGFAAETLATNLNAATTIAPLPDGRIFIADQTGHLRLWKEGRLLDTPALTLRVTDFWERGLIGLALDPDFARTQRVFLLYVTDKPFVHHVLSRFTLEGDVIDAASETVLLEGDDQSRLGGTVPAGHQGGPLRFGPDGKLYGSIGENTAGEPSQRLDTFQGKILRLNPDGSIPDDNPFLGQTTGKYRAIYARGVRNCFGIATQSKADGGRVFFTDVGGSAFEEINELKAGANYGWPRAEGVSTNTAFVNPLHAYPPMVGQSIVGGVFIPKDGSAGHGSQRAAVDSSAIRGAGMDSPHAGYPEKWRGKLLVADFMKHWIKALDPEAPTNLVTFARGLNGPVALELATDGSLLVLNRGAVWRDPKTFVSNAGSLIRIGYVGEGKLAARAAAKPESATIVPALGLPSEAGALPRTIAREDWDKRIRGAKRWPLWLQNRAWYPHAGERVGLYLPPGSAVRLDSPDRDVQLPPGAVVVRDFGVTTWQPILTKYRSGGPIETRLVVVGAPRGYGASYRWTSPDRAELVEDGELSVFENVRDKDSSEPVGRKIKLAWWFPGVDEGSPFPLSNPAYWISLAQSDFVLESRPNATNKTVNWLRSMRRAGVLETSLTPGQLDAIQPGVNWSHPIGSAEARVRSYLHAHCSVCHQPGGASRGAFDARITTPLAQAGLLNAIPAAGDLGIPGAKMVVPGDPGKSILYQRLKRTDFFRMPPVSVNDVPSPILPVLETWIRGLANHERPASK